jgi:hypothetical protein
LDEGGFKVQIVDRYVYAVIRNLPQSQREEVERKVRAVIDEKMTQNNGEFSYEQKLEKVLAELGEPSALAEKFIDHKGFIIGPRNYYNYMLVLKIVIGCTLLVVSIEYVLKLIFSPGGFDFIKIVFRYLSGLLSGAVQGFIWVTIVFLIFDYIGFKADKNSVKGKPWSLSNLPELPEKKALIPKSESIFSIVFSTLFIMVVYFAPQYLSVYIPDSNSHYTITPIFDLEVLSSFRPLLFAIFLITLIKEVLKLISGRWGLRLGLAVTGLNAAALILTLIIFRNTAIFNSSLPAVFDSFANLKVEAESGWVIFKEWFFIVFIVGYGIDTLVALIKGIKYSSL